MKMVIRSISVIVGLLATCGCYGHGMREIYAVGGQTTSEIIGPRNVYFDAREHVVNDAELERLCSSLRAVEAAFLYIDDMPLTDRSMDCFLRIKSLRTVSAKGSKITIAGLLRLGAHPRLSHISVTADVVSVSDLAQVNAKWPKLEVSRYAKNEKQEWVEVK